MKTNEDKNFENKQRMSRLEKNKHLYEKISESNLENFDVFSNTTIIGANDTNQIDIEKIKKILDNKYNETPRRKTIKIETEETIIEKELSNTKEYDINAILDKAKSEKTVSYEEQRVKKPVETNYEILKNLDVLAEKEKTDEEDVETEEAYQTSPLSVTSEEPQELLDLINTIVINEKKLKEENTSIALDLFEDLKADGNEEITEKISEIAVDNTIEKAVKKEINVESINLSEETENLEEMFETKETKFKKSDFESLEDESDASNILIKILMILLIIGFIAGMYIFLTTFLEI